MNIENKKLISIILPVYNGEKYLARAVESVLAQEYQNWELLILDDCSQDDSGKVAQVFLSDPRIKYFKNEVNLDIPKNLNQGLRLAQGEYIARIDHDDEWIDKEKLTKQIEFLEANGTHVLVGTDAFVHNADGTRIGRYNMPKTDADIRKRMLAKNCFLHASIMARRRAIEKVRMYSEERAMRCLEDYDLWLRLGTIGKLANLDSSSVMITVHPGSMTAKNRVKQARGSLALNLLYSKRYPNYLIGHFVGLLRLGFFKFISAFPRASKYIYKLQVIYKNL